MAARIRRALRDDGPASVLPYLYSSSAAVLASQALTPLLFARLGVPEVAHTICAATAGQAWDDTFGDMLVDRSAGRAGQPARRGLGRQPDRLQHPPPAAPDRGQGQRRPAGGDRSPPDRRGPPRRPPPGRAPGHGRRARLRRGPTARGAGRGGRAVLRRPREWCRGVPGVRRASGRSPAPQTSAGVRSAEIEELAGLVASVRPALLRIGWGPERNRNGGSSCRADPRAVGAGRSLRPAGLRHHRQPRRRVDRCAPSGWPSGPCPRWPARST